MRQVTDHLLGLGHRRIVHLASAVDTWTFAVRARALAEAVRAGPGRRPAHRDRPPWTYGPGREAAEAVLAAPGPAPTALVCDDDILAAGACKAARRLGLRVPDDISVTGFDDLALATAVEPELDHRAAAGRAGRASAGMARPAGRPGRAAPRGPPRPPRPPGGPGLHRAPADRVTEPSGRRGAAAGGLRPECARSRLLLRVLVRGLGLGAGALRRDVLGGPAAGVLPLRAPPCRTGRPSGWPRHRPPPAAGPAGGPRSA